MSGVLTSLKISGTQTGCGSAHASETTNGCLINNARRLPGATEQNGETKRRKYLRVSQPADIKTRVRRVQVAATRHGRVRKLRFSFIGHNKFHNLLNIKIRNSMRHHSAHAAQRCKNCFVQFFSILHLPAA